MPAPLQNDNDPPNGPRMPMKFDLPWSQLTSLKLVDPAIIPMHVPSILAQCINLIECHFSLGRGIFDSNNATGSTPTTQPTAILEHLVSLTIEWKHMLFSDTPGGILPILDAVALPSLTK
ncbi:hypothetical protein Hypma_008321 [Hypsizygus marmoreus]|uniref:Uncharacterized protein n=1 Tax=Hypsizygus marmoreus TaxID=39966 RepID=A0A369JT77_HYPMA|nr:hypothetical protein Hypma_008321 [Hypsizygus marmoreus]